MHFSGLAIPHRASLLQLTPDEDTWTPFAPYRRQRQLLAPSRVTFGLNLMVETKEKEPREEGNVELILANFGSTRPCFVFKSPLGGH